MCFSLMKRELIQKQTSVELVQFWNQAARKIGSHRSDFVLNCRDFGFPYCSSVAAVPKNELGKETERKEGT